MKKLLGILVLGIGIVLSIANSTFAVDSCNFNGENAITADEYVSLEEQHECEAGDVMEITSGIMTRSAQPIKSKNDIFTLTNSGTIEARGGSIAILSEGDGTTITNNTNRNTITTAGFISITITSYSHYYSILATRMPRAQAHGPARDAPWANATATVWREPDGPCAPFVVHVSCVAR